MKTLVKSRIGLAAVGFFSFASVASANETEKLAAILSAGTYSALQKDRTQLTGFGGSCDRHVEILSPASFSVTAVPSDRGICEKVGDTIVFNCKTVNVKRGQVVCNPNFAEGHFIDLKWLKNSLGLKPAENSIDSELQESCGGRVMLNYPEVIYPLRDGNFIVAEYQHYRCGSLEWLDSEVQSAKFVRH